jgi:hypothetical protein
MAGKKLADARKNIDRNRLYHPVDALTLARNSSPV